MNKNIIIRTEDINYYLKDIKNVPVISHERQDEIFKKLSSSEINEVEKDKLKKELVEGNLRFVITVAKVYQNQGVDLLDLISEGNIGLIKALERFDHTRGLRFISYAVWWIKQTILETLNENSRTIRLPSNLVHATQKKKKRDNETSDEDFFYCDDDYLTNLPKCISLSEKINDEETGELIDIVRDPNELNPEDNIVNNKKDKKVEVLRMLSVLDNREKVIIEKYFGLTGSQYGLDELGEEFGCTKERIRQLKDRSLKKLRNNAYDFLKYYGK